jgi:uncharacterized protein (DUF849 family)
MGPAKITFREVIHCWQDALLDSEDAIQRHQMPLITQAALMGGNVRVGLEDSLFIERGLLASSNAMQVRKIRRILEELGLEVATPAQARSLLALKGKRYTNF